MLLIRIKQLLLVTAFLLYAAASCCLKAMQGDSKAVQYDFNGNYITQDQIHFATSVFSKSEADRQLLRAAVDGNLEQFNNALAARGFVEAIDGLGRTPLFLAANAGHAAVVHRLLEVRANVHARTIIGLTPLHIAAHNPNQAIVMDLIDAGAHVNNRDNDRSTPLFMAAVEGHIHIVRELLAAGAHVNITNHFGYTPLYLAARYGHDEVMRQLLEVGAHVNANAHGDGTTPLHEAARGGHVAAVNVLLMHPDILIDAQNTQGLTALAGANPAAAQLLIRHGATATQNQLIEALGADTLAYRAAIGDSANIQKILEARPSKYAINEALQYATGQGQIEAVRHLIAVGGNFRDALELVDIILRRRQLPPLPIHYQIIQRELVARLPLLEQILRREILRIAMIARSGLASELLPNELRERVRVPNSLLIYAAQRGNQEDMTEALNRGALPDYRGPDGLTAAWHIVYNHDEIAAQHFLNVLMFRIFDPNILNPEGRSLIEWATEHQRFNLARSLLRYGARATTGLIQQIPLTPLARAAALGNTNQLRQLLTGEVPRQALEDALEYAAGQGHVNGVIELLRVPNIPRVWPRVIVSHILQRRTLTDGERSQYVQVLHLLREPPGIRVQETVAAVPHQLVATLTPLHTINDIARGLS